MNELDIKRYESLLEETPSEIRKFIFSDPYKKMVSQLSTYFNLDDKKSSILESIITENIIGYADRDYTSLELKKLELPKEKEAELVIYVYEYFIEPVLAATLQISEIEKNNLDTETIKTVVPEVLSSIKEKLTQNKAITPTARDYSLDKITPATAPPQKPAIDPYREAPLE